MSTHSYTYHYLFIGIFLVIALIFPLLPVILARFVAPRKPSPVKNAPYECGLESKGDSWIQFRIQYYLFALIFVIFDIETVFLYPAAIGFRDMGPEAFWAMVLFIVILSESLVYAWRKRLLEWD